MVEYADTLYNNKDRYCYDFKGLAIKGNDLKALGIDDSKIKQYLKELLELVITGQVENTKNSLIEVVKISTL